MGTEFTLTVKDDGKGMRKERLDQVQKSISGGERMGFGLNAVHERIQLYCGYGYGIQIQSEEGSGTTIEISISKNI